MRGRGLVSRRIGLQCEGRRFGRVGDVGRLSRRLAGRSLGEALAATIVLEIVTLELLEDPLQDYQGIQVLESHDRRFLDNVLTQTLVTDANGVLGELAGGYGFFFSSRRRHTSWTGDWSSDVCSSD